MKTVKTPVDGVCYIWAIPMSEWELKSALEEAGGIMKRVTPFKYIITTNNSHYANNAVRVCEFNVMGMVPGGIDLVKKAVETLRDEILRVRKEADDAIVELEVQIRNLALITYQPEAS